jgi:hypothetical protein
MSRAEQPPRFERKSVRDALDKSLALGESPIARESPIEIVPPGPSPGFFRLVVDVPESTADDLDELAATYATEPAEVIRRAIATELILDREERRGGRLYLHRRGRRYRLRRLGIRRRRPDDVRASYPLSETRKPPARDTRDAADHDTSPGPSSTSRE